MPETKRTVELKVGSGPNLEFLRNVDRLHKNGNKADIEYELEKALMCSGLEEGDSVVVTVEVNKNGKEPSG